jgi:hypothetical protein
MRWCGLISNAEGSAFQASQTAWKGVRHRSALRRLGEVVGGDEGQNVRPERLEIGVVEGLDRRVLDRPVHPLGLAVGPRVVGGVW